ncbi:MAG: hypothetical protein LBD99_02530 [Candidatus Margulisbacteria bacterium]|jgi:hypothetical protein|nr:hypothetical protein [Candidatus Margulisiibacteriota bacterium]
MGFEFSPFISNMKTEQGDYRKMQCLVTNGYKEMCKRADERLGTNWFSEGMPPSILGEKKTIV